MGKILIDLYKLKNLYCGLGQVALNLGKYLSELPNAEDYIFMVPKGFVGYFGNKVTYRVTGKINRHFPVIHMEVEVWHSIHQMASYLPSKRSKVVLTIHDLNFIFEKESKSRREKNLRTIQKKVDRASAIVFISDFVRKMANKYIQIPPDKLQRVIHNGVDIDVDRQAECPAFIHEKEAFFFSLSEIREKKNFSVLIDFMAKLPKEVKLIIAGNDATSYAAELRKEITQKDLSDRILLPGKISENDKIYLYRHCRAFLFPSLYEGFGLPIIEAMRFGKPVFVSTSTSVPEIAGDLAFYWESFEPGNMVDVFNESMKRFDADPEYGNKLKKYAQTFNWEYSAKLYDTLFHSL